jgi:hypothetical protein
MGRAYSTHDAVKVPCGGGLAYLQRSPDSRRRRRKGISVLGDVTGPPSHLGA